MAEAGWKHPFPIGFVVLTLQPNKKSANFSVTCSSGDIDMLDISKQWRRSLQTRNLKKILGISPGYTTPFPLSGTHTIPILQGILVGVVWESRSTTFRGFPGISLETLGPSMKVFYLVGGFNPFEKYESNWKSSPNRGENKKYLKPPPSLCLCVLL